MAHGTSPGTTGVATSPGSPPRPICNRLQASSGGQFEVLFLQLMLRHDQGGAPIARYAAEHGESA
jgi:uncharacterized protein (DUF305 family)